MILVWIWIWLEYTGRAVAQGMVSGNAMDLANMNMNMMNTKCRVQPCQTVCLQKEPETGCFVCSPTCSSGSNIGIPETNPGMVMPMQPVGSGQGNFYSGCHQDPGWMQCPMSCTRSFENNGCFKCVCHESITQVYQATTRSEKLTDPPALIQTTQLSVPSTPTVLTVPATTTTTAATTTTKTSMAIQTVTPQIQIESKITTDVLSEIIPPTEKLDWPRSTSGWITTRLSLDDNHVVLPFGGTNENLKSSITPSAAAQQYVYLQDQTSGFTVNNLSFVLLGVIFGLLVCSSVLFVVWRKAKRKLRKNKDELYFVHKAYRQDSRARLPKNEMMEDPVYADIGPRPEPPPRSPSSTKNPVLPQRTLSQTSETPLKEQFDDVRHDYLELI